MLYATFRPMRALALTLLLALAALPSKVSAQIGNPLPNMKPVETGFFNNGKTQFNRVWGMKEGVGPVFTDGGCLRCHNTPVLGGSSNRLLTFFGTQNQDGSFDPLDGTGPSHVNEGGLLLQSRSNQAFLTNCSQGGEVIPLEANVTENRMAPAMFGLGLIDAIADSDLINQAQFELNNYQADGIHGVAPVVFTYFPAAANKIGRFGKKAQIANLVEMAAFAFAHDLGITNPLVLDEDLPQGQPIDLNCVQNTARPNNTDAGSGGKGVFPISHFVRYLAPAVPTSCSGTDCAQGQIVFSQIGCDKCHKPTYLTPATVTVQTDTNGTPLTSSALSNQTLNLYSDLLLHDLGTPDAGVIPAGYPNTQGASVSQWRTAPLWGLQYRTRFMHAGNSTSVDQAIRNHSDGVNGEAVTVINRYKALSSSDQQALWDFLKTL
jgi:CxxC motif-containing protein (DUF1111 family)